MTPFRASVVIPTYNYGRFLAHAVDSVLSQTLPAHEVIVVDDGSTDDTPAVAERYAGRITYLRRANAGVSAARNAGIAAATGDWVAFLDADDAWEPGFLAGVRSACEQEPRPALVFTDFRIFGDVDGVARPSATFAEWDASDHLLVPLVSVMPSASVVPADSPVRFPEWAKHNEDAVFFNETAERGPVRAVAEPLARYRRHGASNQAAHRSAARQRTPARVNDTLLQWATGRESTHPGSVARLFHTLTALVVSARWKRDWPQYWLLRDYCAAHWPADLPRPACLTERVWPAAVYAAKDFFDRVRRPSAAGGRS